MSSESAGWGETMRWENPPEPHRRRGRRPNPSYDAIVQRLQTRPGAFAVVGSFPTYGKALNLQQLLQNRCCYVTTRKNGSGGVDVYAAWPAALPTPPGGPPSKPPAVVWREPPAKRAGIRQPWEAEAE